MKKHWIQNVIVLALLCPLLFLNIKNSHDWGDDFAQYLSQATQISKGQSQINQQLILNESYFIGPENYPSGFPLLLAPVLKMSGYDLPALNRYISFYLLIGCFFGFLFIRTRFSFITSLAITLMIAYNPQVLSLKTEILSDIPFFAFSMAILYLMSIERGNRLNILIAILIGFCVHIRSVGAIFIVVFAYQQLKSVQFRLNTFFPHLTPILTLFAVIFLVKYLFPVNADYPSLFDKERFFDVIRDHLKDNLENCYAFFHNLKNEHYSFLGIIAGSFLITGGITGLILSLKQDKMNPVNFAFILYVFSVLTYKFGGAGLRFILPALFPLFYYSLIVYKKLFYETSHINGLTMPMIAVLAFFLYQPELNKLILNEAQVTEGPEMPEAKKMLNYIVSNTPSNSVIAFEKPRVVCFYTNRKATILNPESDYGTLIKYIDEYKVKYVLSHRILTSDYIKGFLKTHWLGFSSIYKTKDMELFLVSR